MTTACVTQPAGRSGAKPGRGKGCGRAPDSGGRIFCGRGDADDVTSPDLSCRAVVRDTFQAAKLETLKPGADSRPPVFGAEGCANHAVWPNHRNRR